MIGGSLCPVVDGAGSAGLVRSYLGLLGEVEPADTVKGDPDTQYEGDYPMSEDGGAQGSEHR